MKTLKERIEIEKAFLDGKDVEVFDEGWLQLGRYNSEGYLFEWHRFDYRIKEEPKWEDNIPPEGVPCLVRDREKDKWQRDIIEDFNEVEYPYQGWKTSWKYAKKMTKSDIKDWLDNAPE